MPDLEFKLITPLDAIKSTVLEANFEEVEAQLRELMAPYEKLVLSEEDIPNGKNLLARIRKVKSTIDDYRKSVKRDFTAPLTAFEEKCKALTAVCYESETNLSDQINKFTEQRKAEKLAGLRAFFDDNIGLLAPYLSFEQVQNPKWGNVTYTVEQAQQEIAQAMDICADGLDAIRGLGSEFEATLLTAYAKNHDLAAVMKMNGELAEMKRREEERKEALRKKEEAERAAREAAQKAAEEERARQAEEMRRQMAAMPREPEPPNQESMESNSKVIGLDTSKNPTTMYSITFRVSATRDQLFELKAACDRIGIKIVRV